MPCYHPLKAWKTPGGVTFNRRDGFTDLPLDLPCGQCSGCLAERSRQWALRIMHQAKLNQFNSYLTLTYDNDHLPRSGSLEVRDWQLFAKRLRKKIGPFKFFTCGEYTEEWRPHFHTCLFGHDFDDQIWTGKTHKGRKIMTSPTLEEVWQNGFVSVGKLCYESANYVARYCLKKVTGERAEDHYTHTDPETGEQFRVRPEFTTMSRGGRNKTGGIGQEFIKRFKGDVYPADEVRYNGKRFRPPRYYDKQLPEEELKKYKKKRLRQATLRKEDLTPERLKVREKLQAIREQRQQRTLK